MTNAVLHTMAYFSLALYKYIITSDSNQTLFSCIIGCTQHIEACHLGTYDSVAIEAKELSVVNLFSSSGLHATIPLWHVMPFEDNSLLFSRLRIEYKCSVQVYICKNMIQSALMCIMCSGLMQVYV